MCLIFISINNHPKYNLIVAANRDEFYHRKTAAAHFWEDRPEILGGRDLEACGTWLGLTRRGRISMVTNYRDLKNIKPNAPSRGQLVTDSLLTDKPVRQFLEEIEPRANTFNGFNLIAGTLDRLWYFSNYGTGIRELSPGIYGLSNHLLDTPWPKVRDGKQQFSEIISGDFAPNDLFAMLYDHDTANDDELPDTGIGLERERALSARFIKSPGYGTRSSTVVLADRDGQVFFTERVFDLETFAFKDNTFTFKL